MPPVKGARTYSVYVDDRDKVWIAEWESNAIMRFDPETEKFESFPSDKDGARVRQMLGRPARRGARSRGRTGWSWCGRAEAQAARSAAMLMRLLELVYFMLPAYVANMSPPFTRFWRG